MTNSKEKTELFELCKEVYKRTGWYDTQFHYRPNKGSDGTINYFPEYRMGNYKSVNGDVYPLYTSDFVLEKLKVGRLWIKYRGTDYVAKWDNRKAEYFSETPVPHSKPSSS